MLSYTEMVKRRLRAKKSLDLPRSRRLCKRSRGDIDTASGRHSAVEPLSRDPAVPGTVSEPAGDRSVPVETMQYPAWLAGEPG